MDPVALELEYVRRVYEKISKNFSNTRYKAWPAVVRFLEGVCNQVTTNGDLPRIGIDVGCGNGKNMLACSSDVCVIGLDLCEGLLEQASLQLTAGRHGLLLGTMVSLPVRNLSQDFCICIAALHHLSTRERRLSAVQEMIRILRNGGLLMIMVWAADMSASFKISNLESSSSDANGVDSSIEKEQIEISSDLGDSVSLEKSNSETDYLNKSDKSQDLTLGKRPLQGGRRRAQPLNGASENDVLVPFTNNDQSPLRYYHFFKYKELEDLISDAATSLSIKLKFVESGSDQENWFCIVQRM